MHSWHIYRTRSNGSRRLLHKFIATETDDVRLETIRAMSESHLPDYRDLQKKKIPSERSHQHQIRPFYKDYIEPVRWVGQWSPANKNCSFEKSVLFGSLELRNHRTADSGSTPDLSTRSMRPHILHYAEHYGFHKEPQWLTESSDNATDSVGELANHEWETCCTEAIYAESHSITPERKGGQDFITNDKNTARVPEFNGITIKAIHREPAILLTKESFLATLQRFTLRQGVIKQIRATTQSQE